MKEYELLRSQMLKEIGDVVKYNLALYSSTVAILTFAFASDAPFFLYLLPYAILLPLCLLTERKRSFISDLSTYMIVFLENDQTGFHWETRRHLLDKMGESPNLWKTIGRWTEKIISPRLSYFLTAFLCTVAAIYEILHSAEKTTDSQKSFCIVAVVIFTAVAMLILGLNIRSYSKERDMRIARWRKVKEIEERAKRDNAHSATE